MHQSNFHHKWIDCGSTSHTVTIAENVLITDSRDKYLKANYCLSIVIVNRAEQYYCFNDISQYFESIDIVILVINYHDTIPVHHYH